MTDFKYIIERIKDAKIISDPCEHLEIKSFLTDEHLEVILNEDQIHFAECSDDKELIDHLLNRGFKVQEFPGCCINVDEYLSKLKNNDWPHHYMGNPIESYGITFRLSRYDNPMVEELISYMNGDEFHSALKKKFNITERTTILSAVQKNLTKYEISPHPDIRTKCMTYLLNINKSCAEHYDIHTHLLKFKPDYEYIYGIWDNHPDTDRNWVPWEWCETVKTINTNNTIVVFPPSSRSLHAIKLDYPHTRFQRTQVYGNLWYADRERVPFFPKGYKTLEAMGPK